MLKFRLHTVYSLMFLFLGIFSFAQSISGKIIDKENNAVSFAEIILIKNEIKKTTISDEKGNFTLQLPENGDYLLEILQDGNKIYSKTLTINGDISENFFANAVNEKEIKGVVIEGKKKLIERKVDRLVFNVENSVAASGGDALDALRITPGLQVQNDQISMVGKSTMSVMIDDRLVQLSGDDLTNYLKSIPSDNIKNIEVITTPPAKYDAEGNSGIVNIVLKKAKKNSISGNLRTSYTQAKYSLGNFGGVINYQKNKLTITSNINYGNGSTAPYQEYTIYYPNYTWFEINNKRNFQNNLSGGISSDYKINSKTIIGLQYSGVFSKPIVKINDISSITNKSFVLDSIIVTPSRLEMERKTHSLNFYSVTKLDSLGKEFSIDVDYFKYSLNLNNNFSTSTFRPDNMNIIDKYISANNLSAQNIDIYSAKLDYNLPLKWLILSFGGKISFINNDSDVSYFDTTNLFPVLDSSKNNIFNYKENTQSVYLSGKKKISEKWDIQGGLRLENTQTKGFSETLNQINKTNYLKLFPTLFLTYTANENAVWSLNYSKRIERPAYSKLNPFRNYSSVYNYSEGNPFLQPSFSDNFEFSLNYINSYIAIYASYMNNKYDEVTFVSADTNVQRVFPLNFYRKNNYGFLWFYTFDKLSWWESNLHTNLFYSKTISEIKNTIPDVEDWTISFNVNNSFMLNKEKTLKAEFNFTYQSPTLAGSYQLSEYYYFDAGIKYTLKKNIQIVLNVLDIFKTNKQTFKQSVNSIEQKNYDYPDSQKFRLTMIWNFGKSLQSRQREKSNEEERNRL